MSEIHSYLPIQIGTLTFYPKQDEVSVGEAETKEVPTKGKERLVVSIAKRQLDISIPGLTKMDIDAIEAYRRATINDLLLGTAVPVAMDAGTLQMNAYLTKVTIPYAEQIQGIPVALGATQMTFVSDRFV